MRHLGPLETLDLNQAAERWPRRYTYRFGPVNNSMKKLRPRGAAAPSLPAEWESYGASWGRDGLLYLAEWRRGFTVHELRAMFFDCQQVSTLRADLERLRRDLQDTEQALDEQQRLTAFYRRECHRAAKLGIALLTPPSETH